MMSPVNRGNERSRGKGVQKKSPEGLSLPCGLVAVLLLEDLVAHFAVDTFVVLAVVLVQVQKSLRVGRGSDLLPQDPPLTNDGVVLRCNAFHERHGLFCLRGVIAP